MYFVQVTSSIHRQAVWTADQTLSILTKILASSILSERKKKSPKRITFKEYDKQPTNAETLKWISNKRFFKEYTYIKQARVLTESCHPHRFEILSWNLFPLKRGRLLINNDVEWSHLPRHSLCYWIKLCHLFFRAIAFLFVFISLTGPVDRLAPVMPPLHKTIACGGA